MDRATLEHAAHRLRIAEETGVACAPVRDLLEGGGPEDAYAVQEINTTLELAAGAEVAGWKIGLTAEAVRCQLGVDQPDFGVLLRHRGFVSGEPISLGGLLQPRIEAEVGFVLARDLPDRPIDAADVVAATDHVVVVLEVPDSRIAGWDITLLDTIADNASSGRFVVGTTPVSLAGVDLRSVAMELSDGNQVVSAGTGVACMGDPVAAVVWLANTLLALGRTLLAGELILSGALGAMVPVSGPSGFTATMSGLGTVSAEFCA